jgi:hypothetical protein
MYLLKFIDLSTRITWYAIWTLRVFKGSKKNPCFQGFLNNDLNASIYELSK